ncbi:MAG: hypothetical protein PHR20_02740 [Bacteroidales bacterium]|nr:hypothetical protein [Bacteroidales bacterium]
MKIVEFPVMMCVVSLVIFTACGGNTNKKTADGKAETKSETKTSAETVLEVTDDAKIILTKYGLTAEAIVPQNAFYAFLPFVKQREVVGFLQTKGTGKTVRRDFTKMIEGIKAASDDGKIYNATSDKYEFDMNLVTDYAVGQSFQYISKGKLIKVYLAWGDGFIKPGTNDSYPIYRITFKEE